MRTQQFIGFTIMFEHTAVPFKTDVEFLNRRIVPAGHRLRPALLSFIRKYMGLLDCARNETP